MDRNFLRNLRINSIRAQIVIAFFSLIIIIISLETLAYSWIDQLPAINSLKESFAQLQKEQLVLKAVANDFVVRDRNNEDFFASGKSEYLEAYQQSYEQFGKNLSEIRKKVKELGLEDEGELEKLNKALPEFNQVFQTMVETTKERGYGKYGIIGEFDKAMNNIIQFDFGADNVGLLDLKLFVSDYLLAGGKSLTDLSNKIYSFSTVLEKYVTDDQVEEVTENLIKYEDVFKKLLEVDAKLGVYSSDGLQNQLLLATKEVDQAVQLKKLNAKINTAYSEIVFKVYFSLFMVVSASIIAAILITFRLFRTIVAPIQKVKEVLSKMGKGIIPEDVPSSKVEEVNQISFAVNNLISGIKHYQEFSNNVGKGNLEASFVLLSEDDSLGKALLDMRRNLIKVEEENKARNWTTQGIAEFAEILRNNNDLKMVGDKLISRLAKYMGVNQVGLYLLNNENSEDIHLNLLSCYAYNKKKFIEQRVEIGQGLLGQVILEKESIYLTDIPKNYIRITSGLGESTPSSIYIVPLKYNDVIIGALEIASFNPIPDFQKEFVEKISESIASSFSSIKINEKNKKLLAESEEKAEQLKQQEEEMRQQMEELIATQEQMRRSVSY